jgi:hypothetical protein
MTGGQLLRARRGTALVLAVTLAACGGGGDEGGGDGAETAALFALTVGARWQYACAGCPGGATSADVTVVELDARNFPGVAAYVWRMSFQGFAPVTRWLDARADGLYLMQEQGRGVEVAEGTRVFDPPLQLFPAPLVSGTRRRDVTIDGRTESHRFDLSAVGPADVGPPGGQRWRLTWSIQAAGEGLRVAIYDLVPQVGFTRITLSAGGELTLLPSS